MAGQPGSSAVPVALVAVMTGIAGGGTWTPVTGWLGGATRPAAAVC